MSRSLQVGDRVIVDGSDYVVRGIDINGIYISANFYSPGVFLLIPVDGEWKVFGYRVPHTVSFDVYPESTNLTGVEDTNFKLLMRLPFDDLMKICATNKSLMSICNDDYFWRQKILYEYGQEVLEDKSPELQHRQYYIQLMQITPDLATEQGFLAILKQLDARPSQKSIDKAAYFGHVHIIDYLINRYQYNLNKIAKLALYGGQVNVLELLSQKGLDLYQAIHEQDLGHAALLDRLDALKWLAEEKGFQMDEDVASYADSTSAQSVVDWLAGMNILPNEQFIDDYGHYWSTDFDVELGRIGLTFEDLGLTEADFGWVQQ